MSQNKKWIGTAGLILLLLLAGSAWAQQSHGDHTGGMMKQDKKMGAMMGGMKHGMKGGGMGSMGAAGGMEQDGMLMHGFHSWNRMLMTHAETLGLNSEQVETIDELITTHLAASIRARADVRAAMITLKKDLRGKQIDLQDVEKQLQGIYTKQQQMALEGIRLYTQVLNALTPEQKVNVLQNIGTPFPQPWSKGAGINCPRMPSDSQEAATESSPASTTHH